MSEYERWEARYAVPHYIFGETPNYFMEACRDRLPNRGTALAIADGEGRNGVWLARQGLDVTSVDLSPTGQHKAGELAAKNGVSITIENADIHRWAFPRDRFDVAADIFTQFSDPLQRAAKWKGLRQTLKPGGLLILIGYTPAQLAYNTGGPKQIEQLYTRALLEQSFGDFENIDIVEQELDMHEGPAHSGLSAVISFVGNKP